MYQIHSERRKQIGIRKEEMGSQNMLQTFSVKYKTEQGELCSICHSGWPAGLVVKV
jgi:hypothetical protein